MEQENHIGSKKQPSNRSNAEQQIHVSSLLDLQDFLSVELIEQGTSYRRAFVPLTEGLGLESPRNLTPKIEIKETKLVSAETEIKASIEPSKAEEIRTLLEPATKPFKIEATTLRNIALMPKADNRSNENRLAEVMDSSPPTPEIHFFESKVDPQKFEMKASNHTQPPPLPRPSVFKRLLASVIDQVFVLFIWTGMIILTSNLLNDFTTGFSIEIITDFGHPKFQRVAVLEFAAAWLGYLGFSLLIFKRTFGMWVWSLGMSYGDKREENYTLRKAMRIFWTFIFSAPIVPSVMLIIQKNGRNILDVLSGTNVYEAN